ncbi:MAG TPA: glycosyltransferase [Bacteroidetes bacterium]|nr:glycosyltransferase [Bacteroidota bacterium]
MTQENNNLPEKKKIIFFTPELSGYFFYNLDFLTVRYDVDIMVFYYPNGKDAPYRLDLSKSIIFNSVDKFKEEEIKDLTVSFNPDLVVVAGWNNKLFRNIGKMFKKKHIPVVMSIDNLWKNTIRQNIFQLFGYRFIKSFSDYVWVAGYPQYYYVKKLGFEESDIIFNYYNGNYLNKNQLAEKYLKIKSKNYPKTIVFVGRFVEYKMPHILAEVFDEIQKEFFRNWKLILIGNGPMREKIEQIRNENIIIKSFMQPEELNDFIANQGVFCLPSHQEHWGLVVHEAVATGLPVILSDSVGSASTFLINGYNGYRFKSKNKKSLKRKLIAIMSDTDEKLLLMGERSYEMSKKIDCDIWSSSILSVLK